HLAHNLKPPCTTFLLFIIQRQLSWTGPPTGAPQGRYNGTGAGLHSWRHLNSGKIMKFHSSSKSTPGTNPAFTPGPTSSPPSLEILGMQPRMKAPGGSREGAIPGTYRGLGGNDGCECPVMPGRNNPGGKAPGKGKGGGSGYGGNRTGGSPSLGKN